MRKIMVLAFVMSCTLPLAAIAAPLANEFQLNNPTSDWTAPVNGTVSAVMMSDGDVMMKVQIPAKEFAAVSAAMKDGHKDCTVEEIYPGARNSMIVVCSRK
jgi:hypothetical protein